MNELAQRLLDHTLKDMSASEQTKFLADLETVRGMLRYQSLGFKISSKRKKLGLSQRKLAALSGVQQREICRIEKGQANPTFNTMDRIFRVLEIAIVFEDKDVAAPVVA